MMKFIKFADRYTQYCYNTSHIIQVAWDVGTDIIQIETINKVSNHYFEDADTAKFVYYNHIMWNLIKEV